MKLHVIAVSTRPERAGFPIAQWFEQRARAHGKFTEVTLVDLREVGLPLFDEPKHPRFRQYAHEHTKRWSAIVEAADAFVFVTPEYNHFAPPQLTNALDFLVHEWAYKACGFVSYGGPAGGVRSVQAAKLHVVSLKMMPMMEAVMVPLFHTLIADGVFKAPEHAEKMSTAMLDELHRWAGALKTLR